MLSFILMFSLPPHTLLLRYNTLHEFSLLRSLSSLMFSLVLLGGFSGWGGASVSRVNKCRSCRWQWKQECILMWICFIGPKGFRRGIQMSGMNPLRAPCRKDNMEMFLFVFSKTVETSICLIFLPLKWNVLVTHLSLYFTYNMYFLKTQITNSHKEQQRNTICSSVSVGPDQTNQTTVFWDGSFFFLHVAVRIDYRHFGFLTWSDNKFFSSSLEVTPARTFSTPPKH